MDFLDIFETIVLSSLFSSVIVVIILTVKKIFKNKLSSSFHYYIWLILLAKLIIPFGPQTPFSISNIHENFHVNSTTNENTQKAQINSSKQLEDAVIEDSNSTSINSLSINSFQFSNKSVINILMNITLKNQPHIEKVLSFIWMFGVIFLILIFTSAHKKLREIVRASIKDVKNAHKEILYSSMKILHIKSKVKLLYSDKISSPCLCGLIKPKILIPLQVAENICDEEFKYIIMHELTHLKNKDLLVNWVITLLSIIYWFNPVLLYSFYKMRQDCEFSCDDKVISYLNQGENIKYGNSLIRVLELVGNNNRLIGTTSMVMNNSEIRRRIIMISNYKKLNIKGILLGTVAVIVIGSLGILLNTSKLSTAKAATTTIQIETPVTTSESTISNTSTETLSTTIKKLQTKSEASKVPISSDIVIYNSHPDESYPSNIKVTDIGALINDKLVNEGLKSSFIKCPVPTNYIDSYQNSRKLITDNIKDYSNTILIDIHRNEATEDTKSDTKKMIFTLTKNNPHYEANKKFVDTLLENITNSNEVEKNVKAEILTFNKGKLCFNQDLSNNSVLIEIGTSMSSDSDIEDCVNILTSALKNVQKSSSN